MCGEDVQVCEKAYLHVRYIKSGKVWRTMCGCVWGGCRCVNEYVYVRDMKRGKGVV